MVNGLHPEAPALGKDEALTTEKYRPQATDHGFRLS